MALGAVALAPLSVNHVGTMLATLHVGEAAIGSLPANETVKMRC